MSLISSIIFESPNTVNAPKIVKHLRAALVAGNYFTALNKDKNFKSRDITSTELYMTKVNVKVIAKNMEGFTKRIESMLPQQHHVFNLSPNLVS